MAVVLHCSAEQSREAVWDHSTFSKNRDRLLNRAVAARFLSMLVAQLKVKRLLSTDHLSADGTLIQAWTSTHIDAIFAIE